MVSKFLLTVSLFFISSFCFSQIAQPGSKAWMQNQRNYDPSAQNGNHTLNSIFDSTACGLNYTQASLKLGQKGTINGVVQPAAFPINNIPFCAQIDQAYLWCVVTGNGIPVTASVTNPFGTNNSFPMSIVGQDPDMCWGYAGTYTYRADISSIINGNGNYIISGLPTAVSTSGNDADGATIMVIYNDPTVSYTGSIHISDGNVVSGGGPTTQNLTGFNSCANSISGSAFMIIADLQMNGATYSMNGNPNSSVSNADWWNFISEPTSVTQSQVNSSFTLSSFSDCYCLAVAGLYSQTTCNTCTPISSILNITTVSTTDATCGNNGSAIISVSGGSGNYSINWNTNPMQTGLSPINLAPGNYSATVIDSTAGACGSVSISIGYTGPVLSTATTGVNCSTLGTATVSVSGGQGPYTYLWSPTGGTNSVANNLSAGIYSVAVTDNNGCTVVTTDTVQNNTSLIVLTSALPDSCPSPTGVAYANVSGGQSPYTYLWLPGNQTTSSVSNLPAGSYTVNVTDALGCLVSSMISVNAVTVPMTVSVSGNTSINCGDSVHLNAVANYSNATYVWSPSTYLNNSTIQNPVASPIGNITYTVTASSQCGTATQILPITLSGINSFAENICFVTVDTAINKNMIIWERTNSPSAGSYNIYRETAVSGVYALIGTQPVSQYTTFMDVNSNPLAMANRYEISTVDTCGFESDSSFHHRTLFLQVSPSILGGYNLAWTAYEGLTISTYNIYRGPSPGNLSLIAQVAGTIYNYTDVGPPMGPLYYMVEAVHPFGGCNPSMRLSDPLHPLSTNGSLSNLGPANGVGLDENQLFGSDIVITPNPNNGNFQLTMTLGHAQIVNVTVFNNLGQNVYVQQENVGAGNVSVAMNLSTLSAGVYFVQVKSENGIATKRLVIQ